MFNYMWPLLIIIGSNVFYHIAAKSTPSDMNPLIAVLINYVVGAILTLILFFCTARDTSLGVELSKANWAPYVLGCSIIGLEIGSVYMYRVGWDISIGSTVANIAFAVVILIVGVLFYKEVISLKQIIGIGFCLAGLLLINLK